jgi:uncharacterized ion transporter superfamily protein YfcC
MSTGSGFWSDRMVGFWEVWGASRMWTGSGISLRVRCVFLAVFCRLWYTMSYVEPALRNRVRKAKLTFTLL